MSTIRLQRYQLTLVCLVMIIQCPQMASFLMWIFVEGGKERRIKRIIDDTELDEATTKKIAIQKECQDCLKMIQQRSMFEQWSKGSTSVNSNKGWVGGNEVLRSATGDYIVNVAREQNEEVITFLYTIMKTVDPGLKTTLIVTSVNVLHNWRQDQVNSIMTIIVQGMNAREDNNGMCLAATKALYYVQHGYYGEAMNLFHQIQRIGMDANQFTFGNVISACAILAALEHGK
eukprot:Gb_12727 [translate_table: standard]